MDWIETPESSNITRIGYDDGSQTLGVEFKNGATYHYFDVAGAVFDQMKTAPSKGKFLAGEIKGRYRYARV